VVEEKMGTNTPEQELLIQLETALHRLVESFWEQPYRYFTESDAVTALQSWVATRPALGRAYHTADSFETGLLHREYPTFFRLDDKNPTKREKSPYSRGHYDLAVLNPAFIQDYDAEIVTNRRFREGYVYPTPPLVAAVEFKLFVQRWKPEKDTLVRRDMGKLNLALKAPPDTGSAYMCILWCDAKSEPGPPEVYEKAVEGMLSEFSDIRTVFAICWPHAQRKAFVHYSGSWITGESARL
jgi:hypothetical protein